MGRAFVIVDPWSTGKDLKRAAVQACASKAAPRDVQVVSVLTSEEFRAFGDEDDAALVYEGCLDTLLEQLAAKELEIMAVVPGAETGVLLADLVTDALGLRGNALESSRARRDKYMMAETLRSAGVRAVEQAIARNWEEARAFVERLRPEPYQVIVKPNESAGSDDVFLCRSDEEVRHAVEKINGAVNHIGIVNEGALVQEFLEGPELVVDTCSMDGEHKVCAIWEYDKRPANGQFNVYFGMRSLNVAPGSREEAVCEYVFSVLDALHLNNGPSHAEVKWTATGPCLVEVGARCHGGNGAWIPLARSSFGVDQVEMTLSVFTDAEAFERMPHVPRELLMHSRNVDMIGYQSGRIESIKGEAVVRRLPSFSELKLEVQVGHELAPTVDVFTSPGQVQLINECADALQRDYNLVHNLLREDFFVCSPPEQQDQGSLRACKGAAAGNAPEDEGPEEHVLSDDSM